MEDLQEWQLKQREKIKENPLDFNLARWGKARVLFEDRLCKEGIVRWESRNVIIIDEANILDSKLLYKWIFDHDIK